MLSHTLFILLPVQDNNHDDPHADLVMSKKALSLFQVSGLVEGGTSLLTLMYVCYLVGLLVCWLVGWSVCHNFLKNDSEVTLVIPIGALVRSSSKPYKRMGKL